MKFPSGKQVPGRLLPHPPKSPDMNPIEHIWSILKSGIESKMPQTREELLTVLEEMWNSISMETICKTIDHVNQKTLKAVVLANGYWPNCRNLRMDQLLPNEQEEIKKMDL